MADYKLTQELAEEEFELLCEALLIDTDTSGEDEESVKSFETLKKKLVKALRLGSLTISDDGKPSYRTAAGKTLEFGQMNGSILMSMDRIKDGENTKKMFTAINELTGGGVSPSQLNMKDIGVLFALVSLFLDM